MKKKIILILSMLTLCVSLFAISVSATSVEYMDSFFSNGWDDMTSKSHGSFEYVTITKENISFNIFTVDDMSSDWCVVSNIEAFKELCAGMTWDEYVSFCQNDLALTDTYFNIAIFNGIYTVFDYFMNYEVTLTYEQGKTDGVTEYKSSEEYTTALTTKYDEGVAQGKIDGVTEYKESEEYTTALETEYQAGVSDFKESEEYSTALENAESDGYLAGTTEGVAAYKLSEEYNNTLKEKYTTGYNDGVESVENTESGSNILGIVFGSVGIGLVVLAILCGIMALRKRPRARR